jgi:hypothetical protein
VGTFCTGGVRDRRPQQQERAPIYPPDRASRVKKRPFSGIFRLFKVKKTFSPLLFRSFLFIFIENKQR